MNQAEVPGVAVNARSITLVTIISVVYLLLSRYLVGFKSDEVVLVIICNALFYLAPITRKFITGFCIFVVYWIIFDYMKAFPNYNYNPVHIKDLYDFDKSLFGIRYNDKLITANEYWLINHTTAVDVITGLFYLCWIPVPLGFATYLFFTHKKEFLYFALTFFTVNILGFIVYYIYPAAPPWYVQLHGFQFFPHTTAHIGGLARFDKFFHTSVFKGIYTKGSNVFAAMPSLHSAYPVIVLFYGLKNRLGWINIFFAIVMLGIWFTAVYASHHYVVDVLSGIVCAITGILLFFFIARFNRLQSFLNRYAKVIS
ncbi:phosphatase PAP2 family protein [Mucilaginibacter boryungensis]|uniref:Inositol phosphorylceramide synthase n=1 Tax=Mucilaginibacter boryungensis TaxID=768480 RepID=A0ABR9XJJ0_9SPHI|nr:phosphatase PAP2 family protein [Mucilaginibacter boryungensis]MBE9667551.1 inositol phosphorylceramide synthase [Mucilaginibacter boryungensis]